MLSAFWALVLALNWFVEFSVALADGTTPQWLGWDDLAPALLTFFAAARAAGGTSADALAGAMLYGALVPVLPLALPSMEPAGESAAGLLLLGGVYHYGFGAIVAGAWTGIVSEGVPYLRAVRRRWSEVAAGTADTEEPPPRLPRCLRFRRLGVVLLSYLGVSATGIAAVFVIGVFGPILAFLAAWPATALVAAHYDGARHRRSEEERSENHGAAGRTTA